LKIGNFLFMHDLIIIGAGPAGLSAAIYAIRKKLNILVLTKEVGGQSTEAHTVENYLGIPSLLGLELVEKFKDHAKSFNIEIKEGVEIKKLIAAKNVFEIQTGKESWQTKAIIVATGKQYRKLEIKGAEEFEGKGITYCATCDAPLFKDKIVVVIGAGDAGQDAAWQLTRYASKIYLLNRYPELRGDDLKIQEHVKNHPKIEIINVCEPLEVKGERFVTGLIYKCNGSPDHHELTVDGVFVEIGSVPASSFLTDLVKLNEKSEIIINPKTNMTSQTGIFAAGDVTDVSQKQMIIAAGEGAKAALSAYEYLKNK